MSNPIIESLESNWNRTNLHLDWLNQEFINLHQTNQKDWSKETIEYAKSLRQSSIETGEWRYWLVQEIKKYGKDTNQSESLLSS